MKLGSSSIQTISWLKDLAYGAINLVSTNIPRPFSGKFFGTPGVRRNIVTSFHIYGGLHHKFKE